MPSDSLDKLFREKIEEAQSSPHINHEWNKEAAWLRILELNELDSAKVSRKKKPVWAFYAAATISLVLLAGWPMLKLVLTNKTNANSTAIQITAGSSSTNHISEKENPQKLDEINAYPNNNHASQPAVAKLMDNRSKSTIAGSQSTGRNQIKGAPTIVVAQESLTPDSTKVQENKPIIPAISPVAPPVKVKIVLGASTSSKLESLVVTENNPAGRNKKKLLSKSKNNSKNLKDNLTAIKRDKNPLSINSQIDL